jgi:hypothetical protein
MQATCDAHGRFLDIYLKHPGATSDYLAFMTLPLQHKLEQNGFLAPGLCLFGDNAYVNTHYMATPYRNISAGTKDDSQVRPLFASPSGFSPFLTNSIFVLLLSQLRINIECAFGMLVHCWGILRRALSSTIGLKKTTPLVSCLCRLHNYCINSRLAKCNKDPATAVPVPLAANMADISTQGGVPLEPHALNKFSPEQLLHGGHHFDDIDRNFRRNLSRRERLEYGPLPRKILHGIVVQEDLR